MFHRRRAKGYEGLKTKKVDTDNSHLATLCCDLMGKRNDKHMHADNTQRQTAACKARQSKINTLHRYHPGVKI